MVRQEKPNPIGYKFRFIHLNRFCLVLQWLDVRRNRLKFPLPGLNSQKNAQVG